jgi:hypothetical protein
MAHCPIILSLPKDAHGALIAAAACRGKGRCARINPSTEYSIFPLNAKALAACGR